MRISSFTGKSLKHYRNRIFFIILAAALSTAVLSGAVFLGDSVKRTILTLGREKIGNSRYIIETNDINLFLPRINPDDLPDSVSFVPLLKLPGTSLINERGFSLEQFQAYAVDSFFFANFDNSFGIMEVPEGKAVINEYLAGQLHVNEGDTVQFRSGLFTELSPSFSFYREDQEFMSTVAVIDRIIPNRGPGRFSTSVNQGIEPLVLLNLGEYQDRLSGPGKANLYLAGIDMDIEELSGLISSWYTLSDTGFEMKNYSEDWNILETARLFIEPGEVSQLAGSLDNVQPVFSYFVNSAEAGEKISPFHFITALPESFLESEFGITLKKGEAYINPWLRDDLAISSGSEMKISYYVTGKDQSLETSEAGFKVRGIQSQYFFRKLNLLIPEFPGLTGKKSCRDWAPGVPVNLDLVRQKDEEYWNIWKFTPKILISYEDAKEIWADENSIATALLVPSSVGKDTIEKLILSGLSAEEKGFFIDDYLSRVNTAGSGSINFTELFLGLSFLLMTAALFLLIFIIQLFYKNREEEIILLKVIGFTKKRITLLYLREVILFTLPGAIAGTGLGMLYNLLLMTGLTTIWYEAARLDTVILSLGLKSILIGFLSGLICCLAASTAVITGIINKTVSPVPKGRKRNAKSRMKIFAFSAGTVFLLIIILTLFYIAGIITSSVTYFFTAGGLMLILFPMLAVIILNGLMKRKTRRFSVFRFTLKSISYNLSRTISIILVTSLSVFMIISIGANKLVSGLSGSEDGTGGYEFTLNTARPLSPQLHNWSEQWKLPGSIILPVRIQEGDEASCLNLNQVRNPRIAGVDAAVLEKESRFRITESTGRMKSWLLLDSPLKDNIIPAIADKGVLTWSLGLKTGDLLEIRAEGGQVYQLVFQAALAGSVFQGSVIISENNFLKLFPSSKGYTRFLIDTKDNENPTELSEKAETLERILRLFGPVVRLNSEILDEFYSVENTYITIFFQLGLMAIVFAIAGISILVLRKIQDEKPEICIRKITGFSKKRISAGIFAENFITITAGILSGTVSSLTALFPVFRENNALIIEYPLSAFIVITGIAAVLLGVFISTGLKNFKRLKPSSL